MPHVLVVEDDLATARHIEALLQDHGFTVTLAHDGRHAIILALSTPVDLIVLDRTLPGGLDGLGVLSTLRAVDINTPVLILSALGTLAERLRGLRAGGDDYLTKPFASIELVARAEALLRRSSAFKHEQPLQLEVGELSIDLMRRVAWRGTRELDLLPREYKLLEFLARNADAVIPRSLLFEAIWQYQYDETSNIIEVHIGRLRRKVDRPGEAPLLRTIRGAGYVLRTSADPAADHAP